MVIKITIFPHNSTTKLKLKNSLWSKSLISLILHAHVKHLVWDASQSSGFVFFYFPCNNNNFKSIAVSVSEECFDLPVANFTRIMIPGSSWPHPPPTTNTRMASSATPLHELTTKKPFLHIHPRTLKTNQSTTLSTYPKYSFSFINFFRTEQAFCINVTRQNDDGHRCRLRQGLRTYHRLWLISKHVTATNIWVWPRVSVFVIELYDCCWTKLNVNSAVWLTLILGLSHDHRLDPERGSNSEATLVAWDLGGFSSCLHWQRDSTGVGCSFQGCG